METPDGRKWYLVCITWEYRFLSPSTLQTACRRRYERMNGQHSRSTGSLPGLGEARMNEAQDPTTRICKVLPQFATMIHRKGISKGQVFPDKSRLLPQQGSQLPDYSQFGSLALLGLRVFLQSSPGLHAHPAPVPTSPILTAPCSLPQVSTWTAASQWSSLWNMIHLLIFNNFTSIVWFSLNI